jgi:hypothetical protein
MRYQQRNLLHPKMKRDRSPEYYRRSHPTQTLMREGGARRSPTGTLVVVEIHMALAEKSWRHWVKDFSQQRESMDIWYPFCPPSMASRGKRNKP